MRIVVRCYTRSGNIYGKGSFEPIHKGKPDKKIVGLLLYLRKRGYHDKICNRTMI